MKNMLKIMAMLLVIATVVFAAGCSSKNAATTEEPKATEQVTTPIASEEGAHGEVSATAPEAEYATGAPVNNTTEPGNNTSDSGEGDLNESEIPDPTPE
jgi:PBP1b-binding outer membrane lipoprotein LpoB